MRSFTALTGKFRKSSSLRARSKNVSMIRSKRSIWQRNINARSFVADGPAAVAGQADGRKPRLQPGQNRPRSNWCGELPAAGTAASCSSDMNLRKTAFPRVFCPARSTVFTMSPVLNTMRKARPSESPLNRKKMMEKRLRQTEKLAHHRTRSR